MLRDKRIVGLVALAGVVVPPHGGLPVLGLCEVQKLTASDAAEGDRFGRVAIDGDYLVVGVPEKDDVGTNSGVAYVFKRVGSRWVEQQKLVPADLADGDEFGTSVAISGDLILVTAIHNNASGAPWGSAYVFRRQGSAWVEEQKLRVTDPWPWDFGYSAAIENDVAVVGAIDFAIGYGNPNGAAYVFRRNGATWIEEQKLIPSDSQVHDYFGVGRALSITDGLILIGARGIAPDGAAYVFEWNGATWIERQKLTPWDPPEEGSFGESVSILGEMLVVSDSRDDHVALDSGAAYIYQFNGTEWTPQQKLIASDAEEGDFFGAPVSMSQDYLIVGAPYDNDACPGAPACGSVYVYTWDGNAWGAEQEVAPSDIGVWDIFGGSVSASGDWFIVGSPLDDDACPEDELCNSGSAYAFTVGECPPVPAVSRRGLGGMFVGLLVTAVLVISRRRVAAQT